MVFCGFEEIVGPLLNAAWKHSNPLKRSRQFWLVPHPSSRGGLALTLVASGVPLSLPGLDGGPHSRPPRVWVSAKPGVPPFSHASLCSPQSLAALHGCRVPCSSLASLCSPQSLTTLRGRGAPHARGLHPIRRLRKY